MTHAQGVEDAGRVAATLAEIEQAEALLPGLDAAANWLDDERLLGTAERLRKARNELTEKCRAARVNLEARL